MARRSYSRSAPRSRGSYRRSSPRVGRRPARRTAGRSGGGSRTQTVRIVLQTTPAPTLGSAGVPGAVSSVRDDKAKF